MMIVSSGREPELELRSIFVPRVVRGSILNHFEEEVQEMAATSKRYNVEPIVNHLRVIDVMTANGKTVPEACTRIYISKQTYYRWRKLYSGLKVDKAKQFKEIEVENTKLKKLVAEISLR